MIQKIRMRYYQFIERCTESGFLSACKFSIYRHEEAVPVERDLTALGTLKVHSDCDGFRIAEFPENDFQLNRIYYKQKCRKEKAPVYLKKGYRCFLLMKDNVVVGDVWYVTCDTLARGSIGHYLKWFGIELKQDEAYLFDMYVSPQVRGKALATFFMGSILHKMKEKGFNKVYGYFVANNIPALWVHRLLGYKERPRLYIIKLFNYETVKLKT